MPPSMPALSRTSSTTSVTSEDTASGRRTRRRFTNAQLVKLEQLFHDTSHPTRDEREKLAAEGGMEAKSVTIWFQNRRQTSRKIALHNATNYSNNNSHTASSTTSSQSSRSSINRTSSSNSTSSRPSLDTIASRSERPSFHPSTPTRNTRHANPWDNMLSSPPAPLNSPPSREYVDFAKHRKGRRTLEWACAAARLGGIQEKDGGEADGNETDEEAHEALTPNSSLGREDIGLNAAEGDDDMIMKGVQDEDMMRAALALCGLGGGRR